MVVRALGLSLVLAVVAVGLAIAGDPAAQEKACEELALAKAAKKSESGAFLGVVPEEVTSDVATDYGVAAGQGVLVEETVDGSPADEAGLRSNDILVSLNGSKLTGPSELRVQLAKYKDGDEVSLTYIRGGKERTASVKLTGRENDNEIFNWSWGGGDAEAPTPPGVPHPPHVFRFEGKDVGAGAFAGIVTQELSDGLKAYFKVEGGALISEVVKDSPAEKANLKAGDIIVKIGTEAVQEQSDVSDAIRDMDPDQTVDFHIIRDGKSIVVPVTLTNRKDFYGDAPDGEGDYRVFGFGEKNAEEIEAEVSRLHDELQSMGIELESLPDMKWEMQIDTDNPRIYIGSGDARAISADAGWWTWSLSDLRAKVKTGIEELKKDIETLKGELQQLKSELKDRMSFLWAEAVDVTPQT